MSSKKLTDEQRKRRRAFRLGVISACVCPTCDAQMGFRCFKKNGERRKSPHIARAKAAA